MKANLFFLLASLSLSSCVYTRMETPFWKIHRVSVLGNHTIPELSVTSMGAATMKGYTGKADEKAVKAVTSGIVSGLIPTPLK